MIAFVFGDTKLSQAHRDAVRAHLKRLPMLSGIVHTNSSGASRLAHSEALGRTTSTLVVRPAEEPLSKFVERLQIAPFGVSFWLAFHQQPNLKRGQTEELVSSLKSSAVPGRLVMLGEDGRTVSSEDFEP